MSSGVGSRRPRRLALLWHNGPGWHPAHVCLASYTLCQRQASVGEVVRKICARKNCLEKICFEKISTGKIRFVRISLIAFTVLAFSIPGNAQLPHGGNGFFGYSHLSGETFVNGNALGATAGGAGMNGWDASVEG